MAPTLSPSGRPVPVTAVSGVTAPSEPPATAPVPPSRVLLPMAVRPAPTRSVAPSDAPASTPSPTPFPMLSSTPRPSPTRTPTHTAIPIEPPSSPTAAETPSAPEPSPTWAPAAGGTVRIAVIGDYGLTSPGEEDVSNLVKSWEPDLILTVGDNNYPIGSPETIDLNVGQYYNEYLAPYTGEFGPGADRNRFFPTLGNHDWMDPGARAYLDYFTLPGNERYYEFAWGPVHLFALDSMPDEPDGIEPTSKQAAWLREGLAAATEPWKLVVLHHPPFSSGPHGSTPALQWPFREWGASAVLAGHDHIYERILRDGMVYFVDGLGGSVRYAVGRPVDGSQVRYNENFGAIRIDADERQITFQFITRTGQVIDSFSTTR
jgi:tartrate-resistant acid phosphatase type 5